MHYNQLAKNGVKSCLLPSFDPLSFRDSIRARPVFSDKIFPKVFFQYSSDLLKLLTRAFLPPFFKSERNIKLSVTDLFGSSRNFLIVSAVSHS